MTITKGVGRLLTAGAFLGAIAGCSANAPSGQTSGWSRTDLKPVSQPVALGGTFVLYVAAHGGLDLIGLDPHSGRTLWQDVASPSVITPGVAPELLVLGDHVIYPKLVSGQEARMVAADARTGHQVWQTAPAAFTSWPEACPGDAQNICTTGVLASNPQQAQLLRFSGSTGTSLTSPVISASGAGARELTPGLFDPGQRNPELLLAASGPSVAWTKPLASIVSLPGASTDNGWNLDRIARVGLFVGSISGAPTDPNSDHPTFDLSNASTVGIGISDGSVAWQDPGSYFDCSLLPCPGGAGAGSSGSGAGASLGPSVGVRTRETGTLTAPSSTSGSPVVSPGATVTVEGFDPASGHTLWTFNAGDDTSLITQEALPPQVGASTIVLPNSAGQPTTLDLATGATEPAGAATVAWCQSATSYNEKVPYQSGNRSISEYSGGYAVFPCDVASHAVGTPSRIPTFIGARIGGIAAWAQKNEVAASSI